MVTEIITTNNNFNLSSFVLVIFRLDIMCSSLFVFSLILDFHFEFKSLNSKKQSRLITLGDEYGANFYNAI